MLGGMRLIDVRAWLSRRPEAPFAAAPGRVPADPADGAAARAFAVPRGASAAPFPHARRALLHRLWGEGFVGPGGSEEVLRLATPLGLSAASSLLLLGCGAGGPARCVATLFGAWVAGYETDPDLAAEAVAVCAHAGLGKRVRIETFPPGAPDFPPHSAHHVLALDPFHHASAPALFDAVLRALRPGGQVTMLATVAGAGFDPAGAEEAAWHALSAMPPALPTVEAVTRALADRRFDVRVTEDLSHAHLHQIVQGWRVLVRGMSERGEKPAPAEAAAIVREAEAWLRRARLVRTGRLRWMRWHAIGRPG